MRDEELQQAAARAGLERLLELDRLAFERAYQAGEGYRSRRVRVAALGPEPAHVFSLNEVAER
mgnify:CR=1 FL=1